MASSAQQEALAVKAQLEKNFASYKLAQVGKALASLHGTFQSLFMEFHHHQHSI